MCKAHDAMIIDYKKMDFFFRYSLFLSKFLIVTAL